MNRAIADFMDAFNADLVLSLPELPPPGTPRDWAKLRLDVAKIASRHDELDSLTPYVAEEGVQSLITVLWDRPSPPHAQWRVALRSWMARAGVSNVQVAHVWCYPCASTSPPLQAQVDRYYATTLRAVELTGAQYVLLCGGTSCAMWRSELKVKQVLGSRVGWGVWEGNGGRFVWGSLSPVQCLADPELTGIVRGGIVEMCTQTLENGGGRSGREEVMGRMVGARCTEDECEERGWTMDRDGLGWCRRHADEGVKKRDAAMAARRKRLGKLMQMGLEI